MENVHPLASTMNIPVAYGVKTREIHAFPARTRNWQSN